MISRRPLRAFIEAHPDARVSLDAWWRVSKGAAWRSLADVKEQWGRSTDQVGDLTVFNIGGNKYRLITHIDYQRQMMYVRAILTHAEYDRGAWKS